MRARKSMISVFSADADDDAAVIHINHYAMCNGY